MGVATWARWPQVSLVGYAVGGAFLSLAYFDLYYDIIIILVGPREDPDRPAAKPFVRTSASPCSFAKHEFAIESLRPNRNAKRHWGEPHTFRTSKPSNMKSNMIRGLFSLFSPRGKTVGCPSCCFTKSRMPSIR